MSVRIGLIGAGGISGAHLSALAEMNDVVVTALADVNPENAAKKAKMTKSAAVYTDYNQMLDKEKLDAAYICTPPTVRFEPIRACVSRKLPVFCEKPVAVSVEEAEKTLALIKKSGVHVEVGYVLRHLKIVQKLKNMLKDDRIASVSSLYACPIGLDYLAGRPAAAWFYKQEISGGGLVDQATHTFDLIRYYAGEPVSVATCGVNKFCPKTDAYTVDDSNAVAMTTSDGTVVVHCHTWYHQTWRHTHIICGEKRLYTLDIAGSLTVVEGDTKTVYSPNPPDNGYFLEGRFFVDMVKKGDFRDSISDFDDAVKTFKLTQKCLVSMKSGKFEFASAGM
ncbi:MAG: Gfo/Idh/MocA family oxidoreductase [Lentisphaerae bacterium]|nr:Gfo/Idh/MocA family oxidoreductase [Lentisphaerota bacterium]